MWGLLSFCERLQITYWFFIFVGILQPGDRLKMLQWTKPAQVSYNGLLLLVTDSQRPCVVEWSLRPQAHKHNGPLINRQSRWNYTQGHHYPPLKCCFRAITQLFSHHKFFVVSANALVILRQRRAQYNSLKPAIWGTSHVSSHQRLTFWTTRPKDPPGAFDFAWNRLLDCWECELTKPCKFNIITKTVIFF